MTSEFLRKSLFVNAAFSGLAGLALALAPAFAGNLLMPGIPVWTVFAVGAGLTLFALDVAWIAARHAHSSFLVGFVLVADIAWVIGVPAILLMTPSAFSGIGLALAIISTIAVTGFAVIEWKGVQSIAAARQVA